MPNILVTGASGFLGRNLVTHLRRFTDPPTLIECPHTVADDLLSDMLGSCDLVYHLAGVNRPEDPAEFQRGNHDFTRRLMNCIVRQNRRPPVVFASSIQAEQSNPYGISKKDAEDSLLTYRAQGGQVAIVRFPNLFGKWSRPYYNSVVATFCHNLVHGLPLNIRDPDAVLPLVYVDDAVACLARFMEPGALQATGDFYQAPPSYHITLGEVAARLRGFASDREACLVPNLSDHFDRCLFATFESFHTAQSITYPLLQKIDERGSLVEFIKSGDFGQVFVSVSRPGVVRGNHYHHTKVEKFLVVHGQAQIRIRSLYSEEVWVYDVDAARPQVVEMPPGSTHAIENTGSDDMVLLLWGSEVFDPQRPDTFFLQV